MSDRTKVFILSWERPLYLWASLDSLYRHTETAVDFVMLDNNSQDPLVRKIIKAYERRRMFSEILFFPSNDPRIFANTIKCMTPSLGRFFAFVEGDVMVEPTGRCWVATMLEIMEDHPRMAMLGSQLDRRDFIDPDWAVAQLGCRPEEVADLVKAHSPERKSYTPPGALGSPHNPPGRLMMLRTSAIIDVGLAPDGILYQRLLERGYEGAITGDVIHRHLSLQNYFDYPEYDMTRRTEFWSAPLD
jgi:GT2 family glycosyltransferase